MSLTTIVWFREDLRLHDNNALDYASKSGKVVALFIYPEELGSASYWWLHKSLQALISSLSEYGVQLVLRSGECAQIISDLQKESNADQVVWNRVYSPKGIEQGQAVKSELEQNGVKAKSFSGQLLSEPSQVFTKQGTPFKVFTPYWRHCKSSIRIREPLPQPMLNPVNTQFDFEPLESWGMVPKNPEWSIKLEGKWHPGESGAQDRWGHFLEGNIDGYKEARDYPIASATSYLSAHIAFGELSVNQLWFDIHQASANGSLSHNDAEKFLAQLGWRDFSRYLLFHFPQMLDRPFNQKFENFPWQNQKQKLKAWQKGRTGYPIVDAGMRELWETGYMHNRVRMVVASFLTKHCLVHWQYGMDWFWDTLLDADIANNTASWQWVAGSGADAAPYFRIFNPVLQGERFDKGGQYVSKWVPELANLEPKFVHKPWLLDSAALGAAGIVLGETYPHPIVDHAVARGEALQAYQLLKNQFN